METTNYTIWKKIWESIEKYEENVENYEKDSEQYLLNAKDDFDKLLEPNCKKYNKLAQYLLFLFRIICKREVPLDIFKYFIKRTRNLDYNEIFRIFCQSDKNIHILKHLIDNYDIEPLSTYELSKEAIGKLELFKFLYENFDYDDDDIKNKILEGFILYCNSEKEKANHIFKYLMEKGFVLNDQTIKFSFAYNSFCIKIFIQNGIDPLRIFLLYWQYLGDKGKFCGAYSVDKRLQLFVDNGVNLNDAIINYQNLVIELNINTDEDNNKD